MLKFILKKLFYGVLVLFGVVSIVFFLFFADSTNAARSIAGNRADEEAIKRIEKELKLDLPIHKQYLIYLNDLSPISMHSSNAESSIYLSDEYSASKLFSVGGDRMMVFKTPYLRRSFHNQEPVADIISDRLPDTIILAAASIGLAVILGILLGIITAVYKGSFIDNASMVGAVLGMSAPSYFMAVIISWIGGILWFETTSLPALPLAFLGVGLLIGVVFNTAVGRQKLKNFSWGFVAMMAFKGFVFGVLAWLLGFSLNGIMRQEAVFFVDWYIDLPGTGLPHAGQLEVLDDLGENPHNEWDRLILPAITLGMRPLAIILQLTRSSMLDVLTQDYMRTAAAKGLSFWKVIIKHGVKNALNPVVTAVSGYFASMLAGAIFIETIFNWKGIGNEVFEGIMNDDYPLVVGIVIFIAAFFVIINILVDIVYGIIDPRVRMR